MSQAKGVSKGSQGGYLGLSERALEDVDVWETADERLVDLQKVIMLDKPARQCCPDNASSTSTSSQ